MIEIINVSKKIGRKVILDDVTIALEENNIYGFIGKNGSEKSMLFKTISGLLVPDKGKIIVDGVDILKEKGYLEFDRSLIEKPTFLQNETGMDNLETIAGIKNNITIQEIHEVLKKLGLYEVKDNAVKTYSLAMKQMLGIAQVLMEDPKIIVLDEPFNGLDEDSAMLVKKFLINEKNKGKIIVVSSRRKEDIDELCDTVFSIDSGKIVSLRYNENKYITV